MITDSMIKKVDVIHMDNTTSPSHSDMNKEYIKGRVKKMVTAVNPIGDTQVMRVDYTLDLSQKNTEHVDASPSDQQLYINDLIGQTLTIRYTHLITCNSCGKPTRKSFAQGFCFCAVFG